VTQIDDPEGHFSGESATTPAGQKLPRSGFLRGIGVGVAVLVGGGGSLLDVLDPTKVLAAASRAASTPSKVGLWLGNVKNVKANQALSYKDPKSGDPAVLIKLANGRFVSYDVVCTHAGCTVPYDPVRKLLVCPCHGARFDPARGAAVVGGPAPQPLARLPIRVDAGGNVYALDAKPRPGKPVPQLHAGPPPSTGRGDEGNDDGAQANRKGRKTSEGND